MAWEFLALNFLHIIFIAFGVGGATIASLIMAKAEKAPELMPAAMNFANSISKLIWIGFFGLVATGITMAYLGAGKGHYDTTILAIKSAVIVIILICGIVINLKLMPKMKRLAPKPGTMPAADFLKTKARLKLTAMLSLVMWYAVVLLGVML